MIDKISPWAVLRETLGLIWQKKGVFFLIHLTALPIFILFATSGLVETLIGGVPGTITYIVINALTLAALVTVIMVLIHFSLTALRGAPKLWPEKPIVKTAKVAVRLVVSVSVGLFVFYVSKLFLLPLIVPVASMALGTPLATLFVALGLGAIFMASLIRTTFMIPGSAVEEDDSFDFAAKVTIGHTMRICLTVFLLSSPMIAAVLIVAGKRVAGIDITMSEALILCLTVLQSYGFFFIVLCVWYERLRERQAEAEAVATQEKMSEEMTS